MKSTHQLEIKGVDHTAGAFSSISARAKAASASMRKMLGGAFAAAGAYLGARAIVGTVNELGRLSDLAMKAGMSVEELTRVSTAFGVAGLNISVDSLTMAMQRLNKSTGRTGMTAFFDTVKTLAGIEDPVKRSEAAVKLFGRSGLELQPLIDGGQEAVEKFRTLQEIMPGLSSASADAGDAIADAMLITGKGVTSMWQMAIGYVMNLFSEGLPGGVRAGALNAVNWIETMAKKIVAWIAKLSAEILSFGALFVDMFTMGPEAAWKLYLDTNSAADRDFENRMTEANKERMAYVDKLKEMNVDDLSNALGKPKGGGTGPVDKLATSADKMTRLTNNLIMGNSNDAVRLARLGPQLQTETKKQTELLKEIAENTADTKEAVEDQEGSVTYNG